MNQHQYHGKSVHHSDLVISLTQKQVHAYSMHAVKGPGHNRNGAVCVALCRAKLVQDVYACRPQ